MSHVALNLDAHAAWVGTETEAARGEQAAMRAVAAAYREMGDAATRAAVLMRSLRDLPPAAHDPARFDRRGFAAWMREKVALQRAMAGMLNRHADVSAAHIEG
jgi:hypothetical protein